MALGCNIWQPHEPRSQRPRNFTFWTLRSKWTSLHPRSTSLSFSFLRQTSAVSRVVNPSKLIQIIIKTKSSRDEHKPGCITRKLDQRQPSVRTGMWGNLGLHYSPVTNGVIVGRTQVMCPLCTLKFCVLWKRLYSVSLRSSAPQPSIALWVSNEGFTIHVFPGITMKVSHYKNH